MFPAIACYKSRYAGRKGLCSMKYTFTGKNIVVSEAMKERTMLKIGRISRLFPEDTMVNVTYSVTKQDNTLEVTIPLQRRILRAEITAEDMYTAIDESVDVLEKQMVKYKKRLVDKSRRSSAFKDEVTFIVHDDDDNGADNSEINIEKSKRFALKPMDAEEAVMEMEMLGHTFFVFRNGESDEVNVVYKRKNGSYGLIEPEY